MGTLKEDPRVVIRKVNCDDYESINSLFKKLDLHHVDLLPDIFQPFEGPARTYDFFKQAVGSPDQGIFAAYIDSEAVGFVNIRVVPPPTSPLLKTRRIGIVDDFFVVPEKRTQGIGEKLFSGASNWARQKGLSAIQLSVFVANRDAVRFYEKRGMMPLHSTYEIEL